MTGWHHALVPSERVAQLSPEDQDVIRRALAAAASGPYFPDWEFSTLMGMSRDEVAQVLATWPETAVLTSLDRDPDRVQEIAVHAVLNNLLGYPHNEWDLLSTSLGTSRAEFRSLFDRWRGEPSK